jgi:hypothetical protein
MLANMAKSGNGRGSTAATGRRFRRRLRLRPKAKVYASLPIPPFTAEEKKLIADSIYAHVWQQAMSGVCAAIMMHSHDDAPASPSNRRRLVLCL